MSQAPLGFTQHGKPILPIKEGMITTAAVIACAACGTVIRGMGGPMQGALCPEHATKRVLLDKSYSSEELCDVGRDVHEAFDDRFTPEAAGIPEAEHGFTQGSYRIQIIWEADKP